LPITCTWEAPPFQREMAISLEHWKPLSGIGKSTATCQGGKPALPPRGSGQVLLLVSYNGDETER